MARIHALLISLLVAACSPGPSVAPARTALAADDLRVEIVRTLSSPPQGGDGPSLVEVRLVDGRGGAHVFGPVVGAARWGDGALLLDPERALSLGHVSGAREPVDTDVVFVPVVAPDLAHVVYARSQDGTSFSLVVRTAAGRVTVAEGLASIGAVRFLGADAFVFIGGRPGGVAGLFLARASSSDLAVCLTNCALRTGQPWGDAFVPPPADLESASIDGEVLSYVDASGLTHAVRIAGADR